MIKKLLAGPIGVLILIALAIPVLATSGISNAIYYGTIRAINSSTIASHVSCNASINSTALIAAGLINSTATDVAIRNSTGADTAFMPGYDNNPWAVWFDSVPGNGNIDATLYTNSVNGTTRYFPGTDGMTTSDNASWDLGDNFTYSAKGWLDTTAGADKYILDKPGAISIYDSPTVSGNITANIWDSDNLTYDTGDDANRQVYGVNWESTTFTTASTSRFYLTSFKLKLYRSADSPGDVTASIRATDPATGKPTGADLASATIAGAGITTVSPGVFYEFNCADISLTAGTKYAIVLRAIAGDGTHYIYWRDDTSTGYAGGAQQLSGDSGGTWAAPSASIDCLFQLFGYTASGASVSATSISSSEHTVNVAMESPFFGIGVDNTTALLPIAGNLVANAPLWQTECSTDPFTTIDANAYSFNPSGATWSSSGYVFDGNDLIDGGDQTLLRPGSQSMTFIIWINPTNFADDRALFSKGDVTGNAAGSYHIYFPSSSLRVYYQSSTAKNFTTAVPTGTWSQIVVVCNHTNDSITVYKNAVQIGSPSSDTWQTGNTRTDQFYIGANDLGGATDHFVGTIGEARIYNKAFSPAEVQQDYNATAWKYTGATDRQIYSTLTSVPNNDNPYVSFQNNVVPYVEYQKIWVSGLLKQNIAWNYGATFDNQASTGDDATPTFRTTSSDADVSASLISFTPLVLATASENESMTWGEMMTTPPTTPTTAYSENTTPGIFFQPLVTTFWGLTGYPESIFWYNFAFIFILAGGILTFWAFAKNNVAALLLKCIIMTAIMVFWSLPGPNIYGMYVVIYFVFFCFGILVLSKNYGW